ncbi:hypothetical protein T10_5152 [Trichinella papuae]|uniref:Uncharacterized protein n=1 Tax=Trichinella papuae TaxID=268474 RepID=A0A0V1MRR4_9BILA|nr:hypothetical protein T10_5152 [Trichinella papuae]
MKDSNSLPVVVVGVKRSTAYRAETSIIHKFSENNVQCNGGPKDLECMVEVDGTTYAVVRNAKVIIPLNCDDEEAKTSGKRGTYSNNEDFLSQIEMERDELMHLIPTPSERQMINLEFEDTDGAVIAEASDESTTKIHCENNATECVAMEEEATEDCCQNQENKLKAIKGTSRYRFRPKRTYRGKITTPPYLRQVTFDIEWLRFGEYQVDCSDVVELATFNITLYCRELSYTINVVDAFNSNVSFLANITIPLSNVKSMAFTDDNSVVLALKKPASVKNSKRRLAYPQGFDIFDGSLENSTVHYFKLRKQVASVEILRKLIKFDANLKDRLVTFKSGLGIVYKESSLPYSYNDIWRNKFIASIQEQRRRNDLKIANMTVYTHQWLFIVKQEKLAQG